MPTYAPPVGFYFRVEFPALGASSSDNSFQEVSGLTMELAVEEFPEGGENRFTHRFPDRPKQGNLVLKRGLHVDSSLVAWCKEAIEEFVFTPTDVFVTLLNEKHEPLSDSYNFINAWPIKWAVSDFRAQDNSLVIETLELCYEHFRKIRI